MGTMPSIKIKSARRKVIPMMSILWEADTPHVGGDVPRNCSGMGIPKPNPLRIWGPTWTFECSSFLGSLPNILANNSQQSQKTTTLEGPGSSKIRNYLKPPSILYHTMIYHTIKAHTIMIYHTMAWLSERPAAACRPSEGSTRALRLQVIRILAIIT